MPREVTATTTQPTDDMCGARPVASRVRQLTPKQARFVQEYLVDLNATQAAIRAGYSERTAYRIGADLLQKTSLQNAIEAALKERERRVEVTQDQVLRDLLEVKERCLQRAPVTDMQKRQVQDEAGRDVWAFDAKGALRALELLGKHLGMFVDRARVDLDGGLDIRVSYDDSGDG